VNEISFASTQAQQDIYGHPKAGKDPFLKSGFYKSFDNAKPSISRMRDPEEHRQARKALSHAFSTKALRDQQDIVLKYVHLLVKQVKAKGDTEEGIDLNDVSLYIIL
jgi:cytochrome P450